MKNKNVTYLLLASVVLVWGVAIYQLTSSLFFSKVESEVAVRKSKKQANSIVDKPFELSNNYRDPFLGNFKSYSKPVVRKQEVKKVVKESSMPVPVDFSFIKYIGKIKNQKTGKEVALVSIYNSNYFLSDGDSVASVILKRSFKDSIEIYYMKRKYFIRK